MLKRTVCIACVRCVWMPARPCVCVCIRRLIVVVAVVVVVVYVAAGLLMKAGVIKSVHQGPRLRAASLKLRLIENGTAVMI